MENNNLNIMELPAIVMNDFVPFPYTEMRIDLSAKTSFEALKVAEQYQNMIVVLIPDNNTNSGYKEIGVIGKILLNMSMPGNTKRVKLSYTERCRIINVKEEQGTLIVDCETNIETRGNEQEIVPLMNLISSEIESDTQKLPIENREAFNKVLKEANVERFPDLLINTLRFDYQTKLKYLTILSLSERLKQLLQDLHLQKYFFDIESKIDDDVKKNINESQKEYYLREKIRAIQDELGDRVKKDSDVEELRTKILDAKMPKNVEEKALKELKRYQSSSFNSPETGIIRTYLDFLVSLPWSSESVDNLDIMAAKDELDREHYGLEKVKERILEYLAVKILNKKNPQAILCLVGPPGVGKTSLARSIASALDKKFVKESLGGVRDEAEIRGHRRTYIGALPGRILQGIQRAKTNNPVFLLDEIDKLSSDYKGDPTSALLEVLDPEQNKLFSDHYLEETFDLSKVFFICTANYIGNIPAPLRDRMEIVELSSYTEYEKFEIAKRHLINKQMMLHGIDEKQLQITDQAIYKIIQSYTRETGVRELERYIGSICRKVIKKLLMEKIKSFEVTVDNIEELLGKERFTNNKVDDNDQVGVVTGLAYTQYGGDTLAVEVAYYTGAGHLVITGKLGDVMKESCHAALSYVKSNATKFGIDDNLFKENDIHIHVPEGAIPKDGPSAGVTIVTALVSALSNQKVRHDIGMTGEITLRGRVLPIGGLREKSIAACRSGLKTILIPYENGKDLDEVPTSVKAQLEIIQVKTIDEVINLAIKK